MDKHFQDDIDAIGRIDAVPAILDVVCRITGMGFAAVARVTEDRWIACSVLDRIDFGLKPGGELKVETTICNEIRASGREVVIDHVSEDMAFCRHPTPALYGFQSYISVPIVRKNGAFFGTLCAIDPRPAKLDSPQIRGMFRLFAELIALHLDMTEKLATTQAALEDERHIAELRDQFIAVLGHDLRNPVASIDSGTRLLLRTPLNEKALEIVTLVQGSVLRMKGLIDNLLDFARGRLGGGLHLQRNAIGDLQPTLQQVVDELSLAWPGRKIETHFALQAPIEADRLRLAQLLSNLLGNALSYGAADQPVRVDVSGDAGGFELSVANAGEPIAPALMGDLFKPFSRGSARGEARGREGLGLGLYIASEIASAHGGALRVTSDAAQTRFTFTMPAS